MATGKSRESKKFFIATYIHISSNNENHNNTFQRNVDIPWMGNVCKHCQSTFGIKATNIAMHIRMHGNKTRATNAVLRLRIRQPTLIFLPERFSLAAYQKSAHALYKVCEVY